MPTRAEKATNARIAKQFGQKIADDGCNKAMEILKENQVDVIDSATGQRKKALAHVAPVLEKKGLAHSRRTTIYMGWTQAQYDRIRVKRGENE